jgi:hypothetical protein
VIRHLFTAVSILSLLLCIGITGVGIKGGSLRVRERVAGGDVIVGIIEGKPAVWYCDMQPCLPGLRPIGAYAIHYNAYKPAWGGSLLGFRLSRETFPLNRDFRLEIPAWLAGFALGILSWGLWRRRPSRPQPAPPRCLCCGYDMRATPQRCPECGTPVVVKLDRSRCVSVTGLPKSDRCDDDRD